MSNQGSKRAGLPLRVICAGAILVGILAACGGGSGDSGAGGNGSGSTTGTTPGGTTPGTQAQKLFLDPTWRTSNARISVDTSGGRHAAFYYYEPGI